MRTARLTFYGGDYPPTAVPMDFLEFNTGTGAFFGPALTKWFQLLNRIKFSSPTKGVIYRVRFAWHCSAS